jgi:hypothetical protein
MPDVLLHSRHHKLNNACADSTPTVPYLAARRAAACHNTALLQPHQFAGDGGGVLCPGQHSRRAGSCRRAVLHPCRHHSCKKHMQQVGRIQTCSKPKTHACWLCTSKSSSRHAHATTKAAADAILGSCGGCFYVSPAPLVHLCNLSHHACCCCCCVCQTSSPRRRPRSCCALRLSKQCACTTTKEAAGADEFAILYCRTQPSSPGCRPRACFALRLLGDLRCIAILYCTDSI